MGRPKYDHVDQEDRLAQLSSRTETITKSFVTDLWMKVLHRAIDDVVLFTVMRDSDIPLKEEDLELAQSAHDFLFDDTYRIPMDDYNVFIHCDNCGNYSYQDKMSNLAAGNSKCPKCLTVQDEKTVEYNISQEYRVKDVSLEELLSMWNIEDVEGFRKGTKARIAELVMKKKNAAYARAQAKEKKENLMAKSKSLRVIETKDNFQEPTDDDLSEFDKGIIKVLDEAKEMLMAKNRKYGNSATNPVRAFSKADPKEQIRVRMDDKISRLVRSNSSDDDEDVPADLLGYLTIYIALDKGYIK